jgi:flavocytochrome c
MLRRRPLLFGLAALPFAPAAFAEDKPDRIWDVAVIGSGMAGFAAACSAAEAGASVLILEKGPLVGGHTVFSSGSITAVSPKRLAPYNETDSVELFVADALEFNGGQGDKELLRVLGEQSEAGLDWLEGMGILFGPPFQAKSGGINRTFTMPGNSAGRSYILALAHYAKSLGVAVEMNCRAESLAFADNLWTAATNRGAFQAASVVIATGGFTANKEMRKKADPKVTDAMRTTANPTGLAFDGADGDGIAIAEKLGCDITSGMGVQVLPFSGGRLLDYTGGDIYINAAGDRFVDELSGWKNVAEAVCRLKNREFWVITDSESIKGASLGFKLINGIVHKSETLEDMARSIGVMPEKLKQTLDGYNREADKETPDAQGRRRLWPVRTPPYYWGRETIYVHTTFDGIRTDSAAHVLKSGSPVTGLYAAGETVGGIYCNDRIGGGSLTNCLVMGRIAGKNAARRA